MMNTDREMEKSLLKGIFPALSGTFVYIGVCQKWQALFYMFLRKPAAYNILDEIVDDF